MLADLITGQMYAQSALDSSQMSLIIDNLEVLSPCPWKVECARHNQPDLAVQRERPH